MSTIYVTDLPYDIADLLDAADGHPDLTEWEEDFIADMRQRYVQYGDRTVLSERQEESLDRIRRKIA